MPQVKDQDAEVVRIQKMNDDQRMAVNFLDIQERLDALVRAGSRKIARQAGKLAQQSVKGSAGNPKGKQIDQANLDTLILLMAQFMAKTATARHLSPNDDAFEEAMDELSNLCFEINARFSYFYEDLTKQDRVR